jgi:hypothetical protein
VAKRETGGKAAAGTDTQEAMNARLADMAEQLGRMAGRLAAKADAMGDQQALGRQLATMRDNAAGMLAQLRGRAAEAVAAAQASVKSGTAKAARSAKRGTGAKAAKAAKAPARATTRSGGVVDAPGKKHRTPPPAVLGSGAAAGQSARRLAATPMSKTPRRRGRG